MSLRNSSPLANVFTAFSKGLSVGDQSSVAPSSAVPAPSGGSDTFNLLQLLKVLEDAPDGRLPFSYFAAQLPGDPVTTLSSVVRLMKEGWVEFVGEISEQSDVRLTDQGREMLTTLKDSIAVS